MCLIVITMILAISNLSNEEDSMSIREIVWIIAEVVAGVLRKK